MNRFQRIGMCCLNMHFATCWQFFESVNNLRAFLLHHRYAGRHLVCTNMGMENSPLENIVTIRIR